MSTSQTNSAKDSARGRVQIVLTLAQLLERLEASRAALDADQYQVVVARLKAALSQPLPDDALNAVLGAYPAAAELYENMHYAVSGLSRSSLDRSVSSEQLAAQLLGRFARGRKPSAARQQPFGGA